MKAFAFFLFLAGLSDLFGQLSQEGDLHGTIILQAACKDGIIICADSRTVYTDNRGKPIYYVDSLQKIFPIGNYVIGLAGQVSNGKYYTSTFLNQLDKSNLTSPADLVIRFKGLLKKVLPKSDYQFFAERLTLFVAGYDSRSMPLLIYDPIIEPGIFTTGQSISNHSALQNFPFQDYNISEIIDTVRNGILKYIEENKLQNEVGGPLTIFAIRPSTGVNCISNCHLKKWDNLLEFDAHLRKRPELKKYIKHQQN